MSFCRYDLSENCRNYKDCVPCMLDKIRADIKQLDVKYEIGDYATYGEHSPKYVLLWEVLWIIDKYRESEK